MQNLEFKKTDPRVAGIVRLCYPNWKGRRKVKVSAKQRYRVSDYWDGGSRDYVEFVHLPTRRVVRLEQLDYEHQTNGNPFNQALGYVNLTPEIAAVENVIFQGKDLGVRIHLHPDAYKEWEREATQG